MWCRAGSRSCRAPLIEVGNQLGGAFEVGKEDGDLLALAFKNAAGRQDLLGQVLGNVGERLTCLACSDTVLDGAGVGAADAELVSPVHTNPRPSSSTI